MKGLVIVLALGILAGSVLIAIRMLVGSWRFAITRKSEALAAGGKDYGRLAEEYRRIAELAVTAQEHTDLKLGDLAMQLAQVRDQLESVHRILKDVE